MKARSFIVLLGILISFPSCSLNNSLNTNQHELDPNFGEYWYQGKAELASYDLQQVRYGEIREGHAALIFVTEDFSRSKQVKLDYPIKNESDVVKVIKLNFTKKFTTGIYPYSTMTSVFTPIYLNDDPKTIKLTTSSQEWCGHTFLQANFKNNSYQIQGYSYFESEGDQNYSVDGVIMEDEVWNRIRLNPEELPTGKLEMLPGSLFCRFKHVAFKPEQVVAKMEEGNGTTRQYQLHYPEIKRTLKIEFNSTFPFEIQGWEETYPEGDQLMTTRASLKKAVQLDYWNKNSNADEYLRSELGI